MSSFEFIHPVSSEMIDQILAAKQQELSQSKARRSLEEIVCRIGKEGPPSFYASITASGVNIIAEIKYRSPSQGSFPCQLSPQDLARIYTENEAVAVSVLTEKTYFGGDIEFLKKVETPLPLLRKDFIIDRYQIAETRLYGASAYLLIVTCLEKDRLYDLVHYGEDFQLDALVEVHDPFELEAAMESQARIIGVNNRDLRSLEVDVNVSFDIAKRMERESGTVLVSESGISDYSQICELQDAGFSAFLIGSTLMSSQDQARKLQELRGLA